MSSDPDSPQVLVSVLSDIEAATIVGALYARGIDASTTGGFTAGFRAEAPGCVNVIVKQSEWSIAHEALNVLQDECQEIDWSSVDFGEFKDPGT
tara:strand:- start:61 stop:342 length:282 start_codon:yes stop_codon:yes gene_type:complete